MCLIQGGFNRCEPRNGHEGLQSELCGLDTDHRNIDTLSEVPSLKTLVLGGETVNRSTLRDRPAHCRLINAYGSIETSFHTTSVDLDMDGNLATIGHGFEALGCGAR